MIPRLPAENEIASWAFLKTKCSGKALLIRVEGKSWKIFNPVADPQQLKVILKKLKKTRKKDYKLFKKELKKFSDRPINELSSANPKLTLDTLVNMTELWL